MVCSGLAASAFVWVTWVGGLLGYCDFTGLGLRFGLDFVVWFALFSLGLVGMGWLVGDLLFCRLV